MSTLWRDLFVAAIQGLLANPTLTHHSDEHIAELAAEQANAACKEFEKWINV